MDPFIDVHDRGRIPAQPREGEDWIEPVLRMPFTWLPPLRLWVGTYQVTNAEYRAFNPEHRSGSFRELPLDADEQPVVRVSFLGAMAFAGWLTRQCRAADVLGPDSLFRVPSDREWTLCARCGDGREFPWGNGWPPTFGNYGDEAAARVFSDWACIDDYDDGFPVTCSVYESGRNPWGLHGVGGNAYEWTFQADGIETELRGGSFSTYQREYLKINNVLRREPSSRLLNFGMRLVLVP